MKALFKLILWITVICLFVYGTMTAYQKIELYLYPTDYSDYVEKYSEQYDLDKSLVFAVIKCESNFEPNAVSSANAKGLMQLQDDTYKWVCSKYNDTDINENYLFDAEKNIEAGCRLLRLHLNEFSDINTVLCAYHAGRNITLGWLENPEYSSDAKTLDKVPYEDTKLYIDRVEKTITKYQKIYNFN